MTNRSSTVTHTHKTRYTWTQRIPKYFQFAKENCEKFTESAWKCSIYTMTWLWAVYLVLFGKEQYFFNLKSHWDGECTLSNPYPSACFLFLPEKDPEHEIMSNPPTLLFSLSVQEEA